jgi:RNA polymerase sigma-B factor
MTQLPPASAERARLREEVILLCLPMADRLARRYRYATEPVDDLRQVAAIALIQAVDRFDPAVGRSFAAFAVPTILGELRKHFRDHTWGARVSRRLKDLRPRVRTALSVLPQRLQRTPTVAEIARFIGLDEELVIEALCAADAYRVLSLDHVGRRSERLLDELGTADPELERAEIVQTVAPAWRKLAPRERRILHLRFFRNCSQSQIAREVGLSQMHVSRLISRSLAFIRAELGVPEPSGSNTRPSALPG